MSTTRQHGGSGLGLWLVRALVQAHGGEVSLSSTLGGADSGSVFGFTLRLKRARPDHTTGLFFSLPFRRCQVWSADSTTRIVAGLGGGAASRRRLSSENGGGDEGCATKEEEEEEEEG
eukprot:811298-Rhodomonas_salina.3